VVIAVVEASDNATDSVLARRITVPPGRSVIPAIPASTNISSL
jgi:hypothetical protein